MKALALVIQFGLCAAGAATSGLLHIDWVFQVLLIVGAIWSFFCVFGVATS